MNIRTEIKFLWYHRVVLWLLDRNELYKELVQLRKEVDVLKGYPR